MKSEKDSYDNLKKLVDLLNEQLIETKIIIKEKDKHISELMKKVGIKIGTQNNTLVYIHIRRIHY